MPRRYIHIMQVDCFPLLNICFVACSWMLRYTDRQNIRGVTLLDPVTLFMYASTAPLRQWQRFFGLTKHFLVFRVRYNATLTQEMLFRKVGEGVCL